MRPSRALLAAFALTNACAAGGAAKEPYKPDLRAEKELLAADRAFARDTSERGLDGWVDAFADDGVVLPTGQPLARGKAEVREVMKSLLSDPTTKLEWDPDRASVGASGDLGYTLGHTTVFKVDPAGHELAFAKLKYVTVWKRQLDGRWKVAVSAGTSEP